MGNTISFKHSGNTGDIIYALAGMKHVCERQNMKADIRLWLDRKGYYYEGAKHPLGEFIFTDHMYKNLKPLLLAQPWVNSVKKYNGQKIQIDLDLIRDRNVNMPFGHIARWYFYIFPDMACDLSQPWLEIPTEDSTIWEDVIIVNRTQRYQNPRIAYAFLRKYDNVVFVGTQEEYHIMLKEVPNMRFVQFPNFLNLAFAIQSCKVFIGNQSMCFGLAEAIKAPRILELCSFAPNCIPEGSGPGYDFYAQSSFEYYVEDMVYGYGGYHRAPDWKQKKSDVVLSDWSKIPMTNQEVSRNQFNVDVLQPDKPKEADFDWSQSRFQVDDKGNGWCRDEDMDIVRNTLVDYPRLKNIEKYVKQTEGLEGQIVEIGVYKGGTALLIRKTSKKRLTLIDTFDGMPKVDSNKDLHHTGDFADTSLEQVANIFNVPLWRTGYGASNKDDSISIIKKKFENSIDDNSLLGGINFSFVHIDVDIYQSVKDCLEYFYPRMVKGGIICVDDYNEVACPGAKLAFDKFMADKLEGERTGGRLYMDCQSQRAFVKL